MVFGANPFSGFFSCVLLDLWYHDFVEFISFLFFLLVMHARALEAIWNQLAMGW